MKIQIDKTPNGKYRAMDISKKSTYGLYPRATGETKKESIKNLKNLD